MLIVGGVATLLLWVTFAGHKFDWVSWQTAAMVGGSLLALRRRDLGRVPGERADHPAAPVPQPHDRPGRRRQLAVGVAMFGTTVFLSQYMQLARGKSPTKSGLLTIPMIVGLFVSSTVSGQIISRTGRYKRFMVAGAVLLTAGLGAHGHDPLRHLVLARVALHGRSSARASAC